MKNLPQHIENQFFKFLNKETSIEDFEQWVYATDELETVLSADLYQELIAFNFNARYVLASLYPILMDCLDESKFEKYRIIYLLDLIIEKDVLWRKAVEDLDNECINSYAFLYIFCRLNDEIYENQREIETEFDSIEKLYSWSKNEAIKMKNWLNSETIIIKGREGHRKGTNYIDNRKENEK
jgi:hypothetical protein